MMIIIIIVCYAKCNTVAAYCTAVGLRVNSVHVSFDCSFVWIRLLLSARASENEHTVQYAHTVYEQITKSSQPTNQPTMIERNNEQKKKHHHHETITSVSSTPTSVLYWLRRYGSFSLEAFLLHWFSFSLNSNCWNPFGFVRIPIIF